MDAAFWNNRYAPAEYIFGTAPNAFVGVVAPQIPVGPVLCLGEGEGRNAGLEFRVAHELERDVIEGSAYTGRGAVVRILAHRHE
jgi:hypothetical protein